MTEAERPDRGTIPGQKPVAASVVHVLLVDDTNEDLLRSRSALTDHGMNVSIAQTMLEAFNSIRSSKIDAILVESVVGGQPGLEILTFLLGKGDSIPVLLYTTNADEAIRQEALKKGAADVILKSSPIETVEIAIRKAIAKVTKEPPRVLLVDDDPLVRKLLKLTFETDGIKILEASGALQAWEVIRRHRVHLILCDVYMADYTGLDLIRNMRSQSIDIPVILFTGRPSPELSNEARLLGAVAVLAKSSNLDPLRDTVFQVLENAGLAPCALLQ